MADGQSDRFPELGKHGEDVASIGVNFCDTFEVTYESGIPRLAGSFEKSGVVVERDSFLFFFFYFFGFRNAVLIIESIFLRVVKPRSSPL